MVAGDRTTFVGPSDCKCHHHANMSMQGLSPYIPHLHIVKMGFTGVNIFFLILPGYSLEQPRRGGSNVCQQSMFLAKIRKIAKQNLLKILNVYYLGKICILHARVFVM